MTTPELRLPVSRRAARVVLLAAVFLCAACGLVYELALLTLGQYLVGGTIYQTSLVLGVFVCAMGLGSFASKPLLPRAAAGFALVELSLALAGGLSVLALYAAYSWLDLYTPALIAASILVGGLIGAEIPLLMSLLQRIRAQDAGAATADLFAVDYVGALAGGLAFPFLLLPVFGQVRGAIVVAGVNLVAAVVIVVLLKDALSRRARRAVTAGVAAVAVALALAGVTAGGFLVSARQALYDDPVVVAVRSDYQEIVLTQARDTDDVRLFLDGDLQFASSDEHRYHEALVHPAVVPGARSVLILGGGDGLAAREVLKHDSVTRVVEVELDPQVVELARTDPRMVRANGNALDDPRVQVVVDDAMAWLRTAGESFDAVVVDMPDPDQPATAKLYSQEFYGLAARALAPGGRLVVQAGSPYFAPEAFWCIEATVASTGLRTSTYHVDVPSFGDWGFVLAARGAVPVPAVDPAVADRLRFLDGDVLAAATVFPRDRGKDRYDVEISTLDRPRILQYEARGWRGY
ncbi:MAG: Spermine synthase [Frankiales bacterium]|nr:Spermine synthase [Frankiales bacterium]